jgi:signal peptidase I
MNFKKIKSEIISLLGLVLLICAFKSTCIMNYTVPTGSMKPTIEPGDKLIVNKMAYDIRVPFTKLRLFEYGTPQRGEVIVFECPYDASITFVKRLIGLPGDLIEVENGFINVNGEALKISLQDEKTLIDVLSEGGVYTESLGGRTYTVRRVPSMQRAPLKVRVPEGHYFAMGDNRDESADSRSWGFVPKENIWGKAKFIYFSFEWPTHFRWERVGTQF